MTDQAGARVFIGVGSNVEPTLHLQLAVAVLTEHYGPLEASSVYRNPPVGFSGDDFLNMVVAFRTTEPLARVVAVLEGIHARVGRVSGEQKFGPRKLDLDLLLFGQRVDPLARVPRADVLRYAFVLGPMAEMAPTLRHPVTGASMAAAWAAYTGPRQLENLGSLESPGHTRVTGQAGELV